MSKYKKTFILDTSVILHDANSIDRLSDGNSNLIIIPIPVLEELDKFKFGNSPIHYNAREVIRKVELNTIDLVVDINSYSFPKNILLDNKINDNKLLACAYNHNKTKKITFVSKDINLRAKAKALNLEAVDYKAENILENNYKGFVSLSVDPEIVNRLYNSVHIYDNIFKEYNINQYFLLKNIQNYKNTVLAKKTLDGIERVLENTASGISPKNVEQVFALDALLNSNIPLVVLTGISGSGKTLLSLAAAIQKKRLYHQIYITRQTIPVGKDLGFIPGTVDEKIRPYLEPFYDNLKFLKTINGNKEKIEHLFEHEKITIAPITYSRGRSIPKSFIIIDEAQNLTTHEIKTMVTRVGDGTKVVLMGDMDQIDTPYLTKQNNGLSHLISKFIGNKLFAYIHLSKGERSELAELASNLL